MEKGKISTFASCGRMSKYTYSEMRMYGLGNGSIGTIEEEKN